METYALSAVRPVLDAFITSIFLVALATLSVFLRLWARHARKVALWVDDFLIIGSLLFLYVLFLIEIADAKYGMRFHITEIPMNNLSVLLKMLVAYQLVYGTALALGKASYLFFYRRIFVSKPFVRANWALLGFVVVWYFANVLQVLLICRPFKSNWDTTIKAVCGNRPATYTAIGAINMATDVLIMVLPVHFIRQLQMPISSKIGVSLIFLIGLLICAISTVRMVILSKLDFDDISFNMLDSVFWTIVEPSLVIINACIPTMRPIVQSAFIKFWHKTSRSGRQIQPDEYPLTDNRDVIHTAKTTADHTTSSGKEASERERNGQPRINTDGTEYGKQGARAVHVWKEWNVSS